LDKDWKQVDSQYFLPAAITSKPTAYCYDLVTNASRSTTCFTKNYSRLARGSGSLLQTIEYIASPNRDDNAHHESMCTTAPVITTADSLPTPLPSSSPYDHVHQGLRYFTPCEIARLHHFPVPAFAHHRTYQSASPLPSSSPASFGAHNNECDSDSLFEFPPSITLRQQYALLGNSLNVYVVAQLLRYLLLE
jgi:tRNA (cytosine38-C5)-methyltransferase